MESTLVSVPFISTYANVCAVMAPSLFHVICIEPLALPQFQLSSSLNATVEYLTPYYLICSCATIAGVQLAYGLMDTVSNAAV